MTDDRRAVILDRLQTRACDGSPLLLDLGFCTVQDLGDRIRVRQGPPHAQRQAEVPVPTFEAWLTQRSLAFHSWH